MGKIPPGAKRVFDGIIFDVYQWEQPLYDGSIATFERAVRNDSVVVLAIDGDRILVLEDEQPHRDMVLTLPGGESEVDEPPLETAQRELLEETGYRAERWELLGTEVPSGKIGWAIHTFLAQDLTKVAEPKPDAGERLKLIRATFNEFLAFTREPRFQNTFVALMFYRLTPEELVAFRKRLGV